MSRILKAEKDLFSKVEGGDELYQLLLEVFKVDEKVSLRKMPLFNHRIDLPLSLFHSITDSRLGQVSLRS